MAEIKHTDDPMSLLPHVSNTRFRQAIKKYFYKDIEPEYTQYIEDLIINGSIESLDTLKELADAIGNDPNFFGDVNARFDAVEETIEENEEVTAAALNDLNSKKQDNLESGVNIKTVNGFSLVGSGDVVIKTYRGIPASWDINHTMVDLIDSIAADTSAVPGESYMGTVHLSDLPGGLSQGELIIEVMDELSGDKTVLFQLSSADTSPYKWEYNSAYGRTGAWRSWVTYQDISGKEDVVTIEAPVNATDATQPITSLTCVLNKYYRIDVPIETLSITLPSMTNVTTIKTITLYLTGGTAPDPQFASADTGVNVYFADGFEVQSGSTYEISCLWNGAAWIVASVTIITSP